LDRRIGRGSGAAADLARRSVRRTYLLAIAVLAALLVFVPASTVGGSTGWQWYMVDTHVHDAISGDAYPDLPIIAKNAQAVGLNAVMLGDHNLASSFPVSGLTANNVPMDDALNRWYSGTFGSLTSSSNALVTSPVHTGTKSLHLATTSSAVGETFERAKRGSNFRSGDDKVTFSIYPVRLDPGSSLYFSASVGGDVTIEKPTGYTTTTGTVLSGKSNVFIYYFGAAPPAADYGTARVVATQLTTSNCDKAFQLNTWITCTITLDHTLPAIPAAEKPLDYDAFTELKLAALGDHGTADAYFDTFSAKATAPVAPADEFVYRSTFVHNYDTTTFKMFPGVEMGVSKHTHRFNFDITNASQFVSYQNGVDGIPTAQATGYPTQIDHPTLPGGVSAAEVASTNADGSDLMEVRQQTMINAWDSVLKNGVQLIGTWSSELHNGLFTGGTQATYIYAPSLDFDSLMHSLFEGRAYLAPTNFSPNRLVFNLDGASAEPYPARYPVYISSSQTSVPVHLAVTGGIASGSSVVWITNGATSATDSASGSYNATKSIAISGSFTYVRAEVRTGSLQKAMSEPIFFTPVSGLPAGMSFHVDSVSAADGPVYSKALTKGITATSWNSTNNTLSMTLTNATGSKVEILGTAPSSPQTVTVDGANVPQAAGLSAFQAATTDSWFYDAGSHTLYLQDVQSAGTSSISAAFGGGTPNTPPTANPVSVTATTAVQTSWTPSVSDPDVGQTLTCSIVTPPAHGTATVNGNCSSGTYTSNAGFTGSDPFTYRVNDGIASSSPATVTVTVSAGGGGGGGSIALVQQTVASGNAATLPVTLGAASVSGHALVATVALSAGGSASVTGISDSSGGVWTKGPVGYLSGYNTRVEIWYRVGSPPVSSVTVTLSAAKSAAVNVSEWSGVATVSALDGSAQSGAASSTTAATPALTTTNAKDVLIGAVNYPAAATSTLTAAGFTSLADFSYSSTVHGRAAYLLTTATGTYQATWSLTAASGGSGDAIVALKSA
jgi:hypothetical protein